jgi:curli biogenesis system outer membrane secretion channel CsgG
MTSGSKTPRVIRAALAGLAFGAFSLPAAAQVGAGARLRVAVMDLSGSALKMQMTQMPVGAPPQMVPPYAPPTQGQQTSVTIAIPPPAEFARGLTEMVTSVMVRTGRFTVLERAAIQQIEQEQAMGAGGKVTAESAARQGAMLGAQALITGDITGFTFEKSSVGGALTNVIKGLSVASERVSAEVVIDLRLIDATTGEVIYSSKGKGKASQTGIAADLIREEKSYSADATFTTPLGQASRQAIHNALAGILTGMPKIRWSARVVDARGEVIYLNAATADGLQPGLELDVFQPGEALVDPETGKALGAPETRIGSIVVETVLEKFSTAKVTSGTGFARGQVVRLKGAEPQP